LQLGGSDPADLAKAARIAEEHGYDEINLNVGCPSDRVQSGRFGACLMREPELVADCMAAIGAAVTIPATVKCRIGVDDQDPEEGLFRLVDLSAQAGVSLFVVHARKAWLKGLSPKENRDVPPLDYPLVHRLKAEFPQIPIAINGGLATIAQMREQLATMDGVMIGRAAYHDPALLLQVDPTFFGAPAPVADAFGAVAAYVPYIERELACGEKLSNITRHMLGLFAGLPGARSFRRRLAMEAVRPGAGVDVLLGAVAEVTTAIERQRDVSAA
jgi:tRNA-dihydrouridine synthase A